MYCKTEDRSTQYIKTTTVFLKSPTTDTETVEIVNSQADWADHIDSEDIAFFTKSMNDLQKVELFSKMEAHIYENLLEANTTKKHEEVA